MTDPTLPLGPFESLDPLETPTSPATATEDPAEATLPRPRTRWAAIVWGLVFATIAVGGVWLTAAPPRLDAALAWIGDLDAGGAVAYGLLAVGALLLVGGLVGLLRRAQVAASRP